MSYYESIDDIERDLEILELKSQIEEEKIRLRFKEAKQDLNPKVIAADLIANATKSLSILKIVTSFISGRRNKRR